MFEGFPEADDNDTENHIPHYSQEEKVNLVVVVSLICEIIPSTLLTISLQCSDTVGWATGRASGL